MVPAGLIGRGLFPLSSSGISISNSSSWGSADRSTFTALSGHSSRSSWIKSMFALESDWCIEGRWLKQLIISWLLFKETQGLRSAFSCCQNPWISTEHFPQPSADCLLSMYSSPVTVPNLRLLPHVVPLHGAVWYWSSEGRCRGRDLRFTTTWNFNHSWLLFENSTGADGSWGSEESMSSRKWSSFWDCLANCQLCNFFASWMTPSGDHWSSQPCLVRCSCSVVLSTLEDNNCD